MKYIKKFNYIIENYKDFIDAGDLHNVYEIDDDYVLKKPKLKDSNSKKMFDEHIKFMRGYPNIFVNVKKLSNNVASVEKVDTNKAKQELNYIVNFLYKNGSIKYCRTLTSSTISDFTLVAYNDNNTLEELGKYVEDPIFKKWYDFIIKLKETFNGLFLDLHNGNFGIDKKGNIKLIDF